MELVSWNQTRLDIFVMQPNGTTSHKYREGEVWGGWYNLGQPLLTEVRTIRYHTYINQSKQGDLNVTYYTSTVSYMSRNVMISMISNQHALSVMMSQMICRNALWFNKVVSAQTHMSRLHLGLQQLYELTCY